MVPEFRPETEPELVAITSAGEQRDVTGAGLHFHLLSDAVQHLICDAVQHLICDAVQHLNKSNLTHLAAALNIHNFGCMMHQI